MFEIFEIVLYISLLKLRKNLGTYKTNTQFVAFRGVQDLIDFFSVARVDTNAQ